MGAMIMMAAGMAGFAMRLAMAAIFVIAAVHALRDREQFAQIVQAYRVAPGWLAAPVALLLPLLECGIALAFVLPATVFSGTLAALGAVFGFTLAIVINLARGRRDIACGCGGGAGQKISWALVTRNVLLFAGLAASLVAPGQLPVEPAAYIGTAGLASFLAVLYLAVNQLMVNAQAHQAQDVARA